MISYELKKAMIQVLNNELTIEQYEEWLVPMLPDLLSLPDSDDADVIAAIELGFVELADNIISEKEFCTLLRDLIQERETLDSDIEVIYGSVSQPSFYDLELPDQIPQYILTFNAA